MVRAPQARTRTILWSTARRSRELAPGPSWFETPASPALTMRGLKSTPNNPCGGGFGASVYIRSLTELLERAVTTVKARCGAPERDRPADADARGRRSAACRADTGRRRRPRSFGRRRRSRGLRDGRADRGHLGEAWAVRLRFTTPAAVELDEVLAYIESHSPVGARRVKQRLQSILSLLLRHPREFSTPCCGDAMMTLPSSKLEMQARTGMVALGGRIAKRERKADH